MDRPVQDDISHLKESVQVDGLQQTNTEHGTKEVTKDNNVAGDSRVKQDNSLTKNINMFQQSQLLKCTLQTAKLIKENEKLQEKINELQRKVDEASQKTKSDLHCQFVKLQELSKAIDSRPKLTAVRSRPNLGLTVKPNAVGSQIESVNTLGVSETNATSISLTTDDMVKNSLESRPVTDGTTVIPIIGNSTDKPELNASQ